ERPGDDFVRLHGEVVSRKLRRINESRVSDVRTRLQVTADRPAEIVDEHEVVSHVTVVVPGDRMEDVDHRTDVALRSGFFHHFANDRDLERLAELDTATRQTPLPRERVVFAFD